MRRLGILGVVVAMSALMAACAGGSSTSSDESTSDTAATTVPVATTAAGPAVPATDLTLRITDVHLVNSEEADSGMRVLLPAGVSSASVTLTGLPAPNRIVSICQARELNTRMSGATCRTPANGEAVTVALGSAASGVEVVQMGASDTGSGGNATVSEVAIRYAASSRELNVRLPQIASGDAGGKPAFGLTPPSANGAYKATLSWNVIPAFGGTPSAGLLELVQGGAVANQAQGGANVTLTGNVSPPAADVAIRVSNPGGSALVSPTLNVQLP